MSEWISVKDRMPERAQKVLFYSKNELLENDEHILIGYWGCSFYDSGACTDWHTYPEMEQGQSTEKSINVTHWHLLPKPPTD